MRNIFSSNEPAREFEPEFLNQPQAGMQPQAPSCSQSLQREHIQLSPKFEELARRSAPGSATSKEFTYVWRR
jgi:hypothetical protein